MNVEDFADAIVLRWPPPKVWTPRQTEAWGSDLVEEFSGEKPEVYAQAIKVLRNQSREYSGTPRIPEIAKAVKLARHDVEVERRNSTLKLDGTETQFLWSPKPEHRAWTKERIKLAYDLLPTEAGRLAAREGWVEPYWHYIVTYGEAPQPNQYDTLRKRALNMDWCVELQRDGRGPVKAILEGAQAFMANAQRLADIANGKTMPSKADYLREHGVGMFKAEVKTVPPSKYADENHAEGRGWVGRTA